jgi:hypothetical protein
LVLGINGLDTSATAICGSLGGLQGRRDAGALACWGEGTTRLAAAMKIDVSRNVAAWSRAGTRACDASHPVV